MSDDERVREIAEEHFAPGYLWHRGLVREECFEELIRARCVLALREMQQAERKRAAKLVRDMLASPNQVPATWHEVQDCAEAIGKGE